MTFDRQQQQFRKHLVGALSVIALLIGLTIGATFLLTRGLVAPMRRLMRAARAVGAGKLDVYVPASSSDELGLLTHTFNHMTQRLSESQAEVANYQRTLEDKVAQRTQELEIATAHAYKLAQHDILTGLPNRALAQPAAEADPRAVAAQRHARRVPLPRFRPLQAHQRHARPRLGRPAAAGGRAAPHHRGARIRHRRAAGRRRVRGDPAGARPRARDLRDDDGAGARSASRSWRRSGSPTRRRR